MLGLADLIRLRRLDGGEVVAKFSPEARRRLFVAGGVAVVIAARNEQDDLPATLAALSRSATPVQVWVAVNGTTDLTAERATAMGARVVHCPRPSKMAALHGVVEEITTRSLRGPILFTDADTLVGPMWAQAMAGAARSARVPTVALGNALFTHGDSMIADAARNARKVLVARRARRLNQRGIAQGANLAIDFAGSRAAVDGYLSIDGRRFIAEEEEIVAKILQAGGQWRNALGRDATVLTRGDRFQLSDLWRLRKDQDFSLRRTRYAEYGDIKPYVESATSEAKPALAPSGRGRSGQEMDRSSRLMPRGAA